MEVNRRTFPLPHAGRREEPGTTFNGRLDIHSTKVVRIASRVRALSRSREGIGYSSALRSTTHNVAEPGGTHMITRSLFSLIFASSLIVGIAVADGHGTPATVVDIAMSSEDFSTLVAALAAADLVEVLQGEGPFTVFAPTNAAFDAALADLGITAEELLASDELAGILTYHVVPGTLMAADVLAAVDAGMGTATVESVNGAPITVSVVDGSVVLDGTATVTAVDLGAGNGVVHVIDAVILPPQ
jgi:uncharacterized surface protein with fasciclin (FAS1) repeats